VLLARADHDVKRRRGPHRDRRRLLLRADESANPSRAIPALSTLDSTGGFVPFEHTTLPENCLAATDADTPKRGQTTAQRC